MSGSSTTPVPQIDVGDARWMSLHNRFVAETKRTQSEIVFIGDSLMNQLQFSTLWSEKIQRLNCVNFGIDGDRTENVLWRLLNGEMNFNTKIKAVVLFVGTNNSDNVPEDIFKGVLECTQVIHKKQPSAHIILPTFLPRGQFPNKLRDLNTRVNGIVAEYFEKEADPGLKSKVHIVPIHENVTESDGTIPHVIMLDYLHFSDAGYTKCFTPVYDKLYEITKN